MAGRYIYTDDLLKLEQCIDSSNPVSWPVGPSPICLGNWREVLSSHPDRGFAAYIYSGFHSGFRIGFNRQGPALRISSRNHPSASANRATVRDYIQAEKEAGRLVGPIANHVARLVHTSPIGLVPKSNQVDKWRMIVDLSSPRDHSVNDGISQELASITYAKVDDAVSIILRLGRGTHLVKLDLKSAYRNVPIHPHDQHLLALTWEGETYVDRALPFGLRSAPKIFSAVADMIAWALHRAGIAYQIHYLDDFLLLGAPGTDEGERALATILRVLQSLGFPVAYHKTEGPAVLVVFLGILIDTLSFQLRLPHEKLQRLQDLLRSWETKKTTTRRELESLIGHLSHAATVVRPGRTFLRQLFDLLRLHRGPFHKIRLNAGVRADLAWWRCFLTEWNGSSFFPLPVPAVHVYTDASGNYGCGGMVDPLGWFQARWPADWDEIDISAKELVPVVVAAALWGGRWAGQHICFHSDNMAVVAVLTSMTTQSPLLMHLLRCLSFFSSYLSFHFSARHVPGVLNGAADALSRNRLDLFSSLAPQATTQFMIPPCLSKLLIDTRPDWGAPRWTQLFTSSLAEVLQGRHSPHMRQGNGATTRSADSSGSPHYQ